jgi:hypothetical protein
MKRMKQLVWLTPIVFLIVGCSLPVQRDYTLAEWQHEGLLPPTGGQRSRVYTENESYPANVPVVIVTADQKKYLPGDLALADAIRKQVEYDLGLAPSLQHVTVEVQDGRVIVLGSVKSDLDARVIVDDLRDISGVANISNKLNINPNIE